MRGQKRVPGEMAVGGDQRHGALRSALVAIFVLRGESFACAVIPVPDLYLLRAAHPTITYNPDLGLEAVSSVR